jgi:hypothetical protein
MFKIKIKTLNSNPTIPNKQKKKSKQKSRWNLQEKLHKKISKMNNLKSL